MVITNRDWAWDRRAVIDACMRDLDFFGAALEDTPQREEFWEPYQRLANAAHSLKQAVVCFTDGDGPPEAQASCFGQHLLEAALQLRDLSGDPAEREANSIPETVSASPALAQLAASWDALYEALRAQFESIRLAHIAHPTGEMDQ
ncbi:MAG: hypothetical protein NW223_18430 [Hyphomicrobiaceae bacterium]|nr:hypothetical protein [Hyphomicrobiaceae bacterium]